MTLYQIWGVKTPDEAKSKLESVRIHIDNPNNLEEWALSQVGEEIYNIFIKGYTTKQWGRAPSDLPSFIIRRLPIRLTFDDNYYHDIYQGIPIGGYTNLFYNLLKGIEVKLAVDYFKEQKTLNKISKRIIYTGKIDEFFNYRYGELEYLTLRFENEVLNISDYQGNAVINYTEEQIPYTRIIEHNHFEYFESKKTVITKEYPDKWHKNKIPYYPVNNYRNNLLFSKYKKLSQNLPKVIFGGRLAEYKYYDMDEIIESALNIVQNEVK
jgi:UDP-galactopyranose mutase